MRRKQFVAQGFLEFDVALGLTRSAMLRADEVVVDHLVEVVFGSGSTSASGT